MARGRRCTGGAGGAGRTRSPHRGLGPRCLTPGTNKVLTSGPASFRLRRVYRYEPAIDWRFDDHETATYAPGAPRLPGRGRGCSRVRRTDVGGRGGLAARDGGRDRPVPEEGDDLSPHAFQEEPVRDDPRL